MSKIIKFILKYKIQIVFICIFIISGISIYIQDNERKASFSVNSSNISKNDDRIGVYISGEVKNTGVYYLKKDSRITDLINICGGLTEEADVSKINPAQKLNDSDKIIIPKSAANRGGYFYELQMEYFQTMILESQEAATEKVNKLVKKRI